MTGRRHTFSVFFLASVLPERKLQFSSKLDKFRESLRRRMRRLLFVLRENGLVAFVGHASYTLGLLLGFD